MKPDRLPESQKLPRTELPPGFLNWVVDTISGHKYRFATYDEHEPSQDISTIEPPRRIIRKLEKITSTS